MDEIVDMAKIIEEQENERSAYHSRPFQRTNSSPDLRSGSSSPAKTGEYTPARKSLESPRDSKTSEQR